MPSRAVDSHKPVHSACEAPGQRACRRFVNGARRLTVLRMNDWYVSQKAAATMLGVNPRIVRMLVERGELEAVLLGKKHVILARSVREYLVRVGAEREHEPNGSVA